MADNSKLWYLENFNMFKGLDTPSMEKLNTISSMQTISKNQPIYFAKEPSNSIFFLKKGRVKLTRTSPEGKELIIALVSPGEIFGELGVIDDGERTDYAYTTDESLICAISTNDFKEFISKNPELNLKVTKHIGFKLRKYSKRIEDLIFKDAPQRVISFILNFAVEHGKKIGDELFIKPFMKHQEIAELTACSRQTVNAVLTDLRDKGIINFDRRKLIVLNEEKLKSLLPQ